MSIPRLTEIFERFERAVEKLTSFITFISTDHAYIHQGKAFTATMTTGSIDAAYKIGFKTPTVASGKFIHFRPLGITTSANYVSIIMYEGDDFANGTGVVRTNRNRLSTETSKMQSFLKGTTVTPAGTILDYTGIGTSGIPAARSGGGSGADQEIVLKQDTSYVFLLTPAGATTVTASFFWYEEEKGIA